jgi:hypothetical protein
MGAVERDRRLPHRRTSRVLVLPQRWSLSLEWEPRDLWIGVFLKREPKPRKGGPALHVYVCPLPTVVLHFVRLDAGRVVGHG